MATKKQKREAAMAKREQFLKEERERGLEAQQKDREARKRQDEMLNSAIQGLNHRYKAVLERAGILE